MPDDPKVFIGDNLIKLQDRVLELYSFFQQLTDDTIINIKDIFKFCNQYQDDSTMKSIELVISEPADFPRFLICLPFFMWIRAINKLSIN